MMSRESASPALPWEKVLVGEEKDLRRGSRMLEEDQGC